MPTQSVWKHIDVPLPALKYQIDTTSSQGKGSTEFAANSYTPYSVELWDDFDALVTAEGQNPQNSKSLDANFADQLAHALLATVSSEENVTDCLENLLRIFSQDIWDLSGGFIFCKQNQQIIGKPDLIAQKKDPVGLRVGHWSEYESPESGQKAQARRNNTARIVSLYRMPFETKPIWKFAFLTTAQYIIDNWEVPENYNAADTQAEKPLPKSWSAGKKKVFHVVRQLYGQMVADKRRYGILTLYERWFFFKGTPEGILKISRPFERGDTSPSIFQAIKTMVGFADYELEDVQVHPQSASKARSTRKRSRDSSKPKPPPPPAPPTDGKPGYQGDGKRGGGKRGAAGGEKNLAASLRPWDCAVYDVTDSVLLLTTTKDPSVIVKLQSDPRKKHVAEEMENEAGIYAALEGNQAVQEVIPRFRGHSTHLGVAMTCIEQELDDFDDIGLGNMSDSLKQSAVHAVKVLSEAGVLHNDLELRNIVKSKRDPSRAKIIDFGRAELSSDSKLLAEQVESIKILLNMTG